MEIKVSEKNIIPQAPGVYLFKNKSGKIIYIGKAINLKKRVASYFRPIHRDDKAGLIAENAATIKIIVVGSEFEAIILESKLINIYRPRYNVIWRDDKSYIYILVTKEEFPRILLTRKSNKNLKGEMYGPFASKRVASEILFFLRQIFPYCTQKPSVKRVCFYHHLSLCSPCPAEIRKLKGDKRKLKTREYRQNIRSIKNILKGNSRKLVARLTKVMKTKSEDMVFEEAAVLRDKINQLNNLLDRSYFSLEDYLYNPEYGKNRWQEEINGLNKTIGKYLNLKKNTATIECYDISNISGKLATGSMVTFYQGKPDKKRYRHFRIKTKTTPDDYHMLKEVFQRRLKHSDWPLPDIIMVDGGKGQLTALLQSLEFFKIDIPAISLAKRFEEIILRTSAGFTTIRLSDDSKALNLLKRIRDESHRFALRYHQHLRMKNLLNLLHN